MSEQRRKQSERLREHYQDAGGRLKDDGGNEGESEREGLGF